MRTASHWLLVLIIVACGHVAEAQQPGKMTRVGFLGTVFMDLATDLGEQGFRWIFLVQAHVLNHAGDYFHALTVEDWKANTDTEPKGRR